MNKRLYFLVITLLLGVVTLHSQAKKVRNKTIRGVITDHNQNGIEGVQIYVDMIRTPAKTDKKGRFKLKTTTDAQLITAWHPVYGIINWRYNGEKKIDFIYPENSPPLSLEELTALGYTTEVPGRKERIWYGDYNNVMEILDNTFDQVRVKNGQIIIGRGGPHVFNGDPTPLILVNRLPTSIESMNAIPTTEIESIRVVYRGSELAEYGFQGVNGVILITLKDGNTKS